MMHTQNTDNRERWCGQNGARLLMPVSEEYPSGLRSVEGPPPFLSVWGELPWLTHRCISIVGTRNPTHGARKWLDRHLSEFLESSSDVATVSGGAVGIDQQVHHLSMRLGRPTVVFLPSGLDRAYPAEWQEWKDRVFKTGGALVSTYPPYQEIRRDHFEERNRWIAAMSQVTFVVEAKRKSGSSMTARMAREIGRTICCLPGPPDTGSCAGTVDLLFEGAFPIRDARDLEVLFHYQTISSTRA